MDKAPLFTLILPAAGNGTRMNATTPKPLIKIKGKPIIYWTLLPFLELESLAQIIIPTQKILFDAIESAVLDAIKDSGSVNKPDLRIIEGGKERLYSIANAIPHIKNEVIFVSVHDAVRPLVQSGRIVQNLAQAAEKGSSVLALPLRETIKEVDSQQKVLNTPNRKMLWSVQTPQTFNRLWFERAYQNAIGSNFFGTDDASVMEFSSYPVYLTEGNPENIKLTYSVDLLLAEILLNQKLSN